MTFFIISL